MDVTAIQFKARRTPEASLADLCDAIAASRGQLVVAPEMAVHGYALTTRAEAEALAEPADGPTVTALARAARQRGCWLVAGFPERDGDQVFNAAVVLDPTGAVHGVYRKRLLFEADLPWASPGDRPYLAVETDHGRFGVGICMDLNDDAFLAWCAHEALDVIAFPTNWIQDDGSVWDYWRWRLFTGWPAELDIPERIADRARVEAVLVGANSYGPEGRWVLRGDSAVLSWNTLYARAASTGDALLEARLDQ